ncbi:prolyl oligopeptidase family serine peptidase [Litorihabitans aurantiacus]|uniref:Prolyl oligopeptidase n=1 Tax=Litorihabitans aurantiacus TaxID=1930061 RepID=A0AA37UMV0_9MICO|nr:prolyl oligopeptidase family serine peptidase [Litorihabitans aurantiacus]GMA30098.1 prolyl oligopeptidase [Litorihabitans aurantiacus]
MTSDATGTAAQPTEHATTEHPTPTPDEFLWLEDVEGEEALAWVRERNAHAEGALTGTRRFTQTKAAILEVLDSTDKIPGVGRAGDHLYNVWVDAEHERGLWRRTTLESYRTETPEWELLLDVDALNEAEGEDWVWHGARVLRTGPLAFTRALVDLSHGGSDADVTREFDLTSKQFIAPQDGGFFRAESKGSLGWIDADTVFAQSAADGEPTSSGYPRRARRLRRGQSLEQAELVYEGEVTDLYISAHHDRTPGFERDWVSRATTFYTDELHLVRPDGELELVDVPASAEAGVHREWLMVELRDDWEVGGAVHAAGSLLAIDFEAFRAGAREFTTLVAPTPSTSLAGLSWTRHHLVLNVLDDVKNRLEVLTPPADATVPGAAWRRRPFTAAPAIGTVGVAAVDGDDEGELGDALWMTATGYLTPTTLSLVQLDAEGAEVSAEALKAAPAFFDSEGLVAEQHFATSQDGTRVPYFLVRRADLALDGTAPTLLYAYGGFEISLTPGYSGGLGRAWLARGGVYVVANIRGGGEYGPAWHQAALKGERHRAYEDLAAVARDLVARGITSHERLGVQGGSNGGLLTGNMLTQYPELFGAVVVQVPLLDMERYHLLLAGASWVAEYGDPEVPEELAALRTFSPYHLFDAGRTYPPVLFTTSTKDDRVHPGHARKLAARMIAAGKDVTSYENIEGGHGGAATNAQAAHMQALAYTFLWTRLSGGSTATAQAPDGGPTAS